jgi:uncharacterized protein YaaW (UPF0174 family)
MSEPTYSTNKLNECLRSASSEELMSLTKVLEASATRPMGASNLAAEILRAGGNSIANFMRGGGISYAEFLDDVSSTLKLGTTPYRKITSTGLQVVEMDKRQANNQIDSSTRKSWEGPLDSFLREKENAILATVAQQAYSGLTPEQKRQVDEQVRRLAASQPGKDLKGLTGGAAMFALANMGGFATYTMMSTVISTLTLGTAGFGAYTTASSLLSVLIGPLGWASLGLATLYKLASPSQQKVVQLAIGVSMIRARQAARQ